AVATDAQGLGDIAQLVEDLNSGAVEALFLFTPSNPVYDAPADLRFAEALAKAKTSIHWGLRSDATAHATTWHLPASHYLECWADARTSGGVYTIVQPMILPLYADCTSELELLTALLTDDGSYISGEGEKGEPSSAYTEVRKTFEGLAGTGDTAWKTLLREGFLAGSKYDSADVSVDASALSAAVAAAKAAAGSGVE